jgi:hypothetical protein
MKTFNHQRGHETPEHRTDKCEVLHLLRSLGHGIVLCEQEYCDVVAIQPRSAAVLGVEIERTSRNVLKNLSRNFARGCSNVLIVCPDFKILGEISRKLARALPQEFWTRTALTTMSALRLMQPLPFSSLEPRNPTQKGDHESLVNSLEASTINTRKESNHE